ncbi:hypothetical protein [Gulbenkiania mobilis]|uniref:Transmembrane protein n=1 Tax=Gulbenkiania mobilis TaxID=397457 RepID=A0ABY2D500_GULMO|nr:hypothetical protein EV669_101213 [Gulbenkiania mobilis]
MSNTLYGLAAILAAFALLFLSWKKRERGLAEGLYVRVGKIILALFMFGFGVLLLKSGHA